jgi:putative oxidoreductase
MKQKLPMIAKYLLGVIYLVFGLNGFLQFIPLPPLPEAAGQFMGALGASGYFFPVLKLTEILGGVLLLSGFAVPLALVVLAPITIQIFLFHLVLTPGLENSVMSIVMIILHVAAAQGYANSFKPLFKKV